MNSPTNIKVYATYPHPCSYLKGREATTVFVDPHAVVDRTLYSRLSDNGFRRSGSHIYRPQCQNCEACVATRVPVRDFKPNRTQSKLLRRNSDLAVLSLKHIDDDDIYRLYHDYICQRHADGDMYPPSREQYLSFLSNEWGVTRYFGFADANRLLAVAVVDQLDSGLSAVYTFYDTSETRRSLGTWAILQQIRLVQELGLHYLYLGYWIAESPKMAYKEHFRPLQLLRNSQWLDADAYRTPQD